MTKKMNIEFLNEHYELKKELVTREKLYGKSRKIALDSNNIECENAFISKDGKYIFPKGALAYVVNHDNTKENLNLNSIELRDNNNYHKPFRVISPQILLECYTDKVFQIVDGINKTSVLSKALDSGRILVSEHSKQAGQKTGKSDFIFKTGQGTFLIKANWLNLDKSHYIKESFNVNGLNMIKTRLILPDGKNAPVMLSNLYNSGDESADFINLEEGQNTSEELDHYYIDNIKSEKKKIRTAMFTEKQSLKRLKKDFTNFSENKNLKNSDGFTNNYLKNLFENDPEFDFNVTGMIVKDVERIYLDKNEKPLYSAKIIEEKIAPDGSVSIADSDYCDTPANVCSDMPLCFNKKKIRPDEAVLNYAFTKIMKISHADPIAFDALYKTAKILYESCMLWEVCSNDNNDKLIFKKNGKPYRAYLEGRISDDSYLLLMHLSLLEIKSLNSVNN